MIGLMSPSKVSDSLTSEMLPCVLSSEAECTSVDALTALVAASLLVLLSCPGELEPNDGDVEIGRGREASDGDGEAGGEAGVESALSDGGGEAGGKPEAREP